RDPAARAPGVTRRGKKNDAPAPPAWQAEEHVKRLQQRAAAPRLGGRRGLARQRQRRGEEQQVRQRLARRPRRPAERGAALPDVAARLQLAARTLRGWCQGHAHGSQLLVALGRPTVRAARAERMAVLEVLDALGPATSVATLRACFPTMCRA